MPVVKTQPFFRSLFSPGRALSMDSSKQKRPRNSRAAPVIRWLGYRESYGFFSAAAGLAAGAAAALGFQKSPSALIQASGT